MHTHQDHPTSRRDLLKLTAAAATTLAAAQLGLAQQDQQQQGGNNDLNDAPPTFPTPETIWKSGFPYRKFGRTDELISLLGLGGFHIGKLPTLDDSVKFTRSAIDQGITFMDNCWDYHNGKSEEWMGHALKDGYRNKVFLMSKIDGHTKAAAARQIDESLKRLQTDHVDLMQHHEVIRMQDPDKIFAPGGSHEAMLEAQKAGKIRHIGFTGHKDPAIHLHMLDLAQQHNYPLAAVQMPLNVLDAHFKSFAHHVLPVLLQRGIAPLGMKSFAAGGIIRNKIATPAECLHYAMNLPTSTVISGMDSPDVLTQNLTAARSFKPLTQDDLAALLTRTRPFALSGKHEPFKQGKGFDGTLHHPQWLG